MQMIDKNYPTDLNIDNELELKHRLLISALQITFVLASALMLFRIFYPDQIIFIDITCMLVALIGIYFLKKSISYTPIITKLLLFVYFILCVIMFTNEDLYILGPSWFIVLIIFSFYQAGKKEGLLMSVLSIVAILVLGQNIEVPYLYSQYLYVFAPFLIAISIIYLYESKVTKKENLLHLKNRVQNQLIQEKEELLQHAYYDNLTGLPNRVLFHDRLKQAIINTNRSDEDFAIFFIDLDSFKEINDKQGHNIGDSVLCTAANRFKNTLREKDTVARIGGDEFVCIIEEFTSCEAIETIAQKIIEKIKEPLFLYGEELHITCSIGISIYKKDAQNEKTLLHHADTAMYKAKDSGKNNYQFYTSCEN